MSVSAPISASSLPKLLAIVFVSGPLCFGQPKAEVRSPATLNPREGEALARSLVNEMITQQPAQNSTNTGVLKIRDSAGEQQQVPVRFEVFSTPTNWVSIYDAGPWGSGRNRAQLRVIHSNDSPNRYLLGVAAGTNAPSSALKEVRPSESMVPFAGSDFWLADLGLEFLHWPQQRVMLKEMRRSQFCLKLESINPHPGSSGYVRVESWIDHDPPHGIIHAEAYDKNNQLLKKFDPTEIKKVHGEYQLAEMEIRSPKANSQTRIDFDLEQSKR
jgi:hypothetical protein